MPLYFYDDYIYDGCIIKIINGTATKSNLNGSELSNH